MATPKYKPSELPKLYSESKETKNLHDKKIVEALIKRLNDRFSKDPDSCKKAALIIESWLHQKPKK